jgi:hypothetical protein
LSWRGAWAVQGQEAVVRGVAPAPDDGVYIVGSFRNTQPLLVGTLSASSSGGADGFIARLNADGTPVWLRSFGGADDDFAFDVDSDAGGAAYLTGRVRGAVTIGPTSLNASGGDSIVVKYTSAGQVSWVRAGAGSGSALGNEIAVADDGSSVSVGAFGGAIDFGSGVRLAAPATTFEDAYVVRYSANGTPEWAQAIRAPDTVSEGTVSARGVAFDGQGRVLVAGSFQGSVSAGAQSVTSVGGSDCFVSAYSGSGALQWLRRFGGAGADVCRGIGGDPFGAVLIAGTFEATAAFGTTSLASAGGRDVFVASLNDAGEPQWARGIGGAGAEEGAELEVGAGGEATVAFDFSGSVALPDGTNVTSAGARDPLLLRFGTSGQLDWRLTGGGPGDDVTYAVAITASDAVHTVGTFGTGTGATSISFAPFLLNAAQQAGYVARAGVNASPPPPPPPPSSLNLAAAADYAFANGTRALIIKQNGQVLLERYGGIGSASRVESLASGTKSFSCALYAAAEDEGLINIDELASIAITPWRPGGSAPENGSKQLIRARDLIALSHGLSAAGAGGASLNSVDSYLQGINARSVFAPDVHAIYSANGFQAFNAYFELKAGGTLAASGDITGGRDPLTYLQQRVLTPIGSNVGSWQRDVKNKPNFGGGAAMTASDWLRYGQFILQEGAWNGVQLVSAARIRRCGSYQSPAFLGYGLGFWLNRPVGSSYTANEDGIPWPMEVRTRLAAGGQIMPAAPADTMISYGAGNMKMFIIKSRGLVVVKLAGSADDNEMFARLFSTP